MCIFLGLLPLQKKTLNKPAPPSQLWLARASQSSRSPHVPEHTFFSTSHLYRTHFLSPPVFRTPYLTGLDGDPPWPTWRATATRNTPPLHPTHPSLSLSLLSCRPLKITSRGAATMVQQVEALAAKPEDLSLIPTTRLVEGENLLRQVSSDLHTHTHNTHANT